MKFLTQLFHFYLNSSIHVALSTLAFTVLTMLNFELKLDGMLLALIFTATITGYNFVKYAEIAGLHHRSLTKNLRQLQVFSLVVFIIMIALLFSISVFELLVLSSITLLTIFYAIPFLPQVKNLRQVKSLKVFVIALVWTLTTVVLPLINTDITILKILLYSLSRLIWVLLLLIPFEIRDIPYDDLNLKTIPQLFGIKTTKYIGVILVLINYLFSIYFDLSPSLISLSLFSLSLLVFIIFSKEKQSYLYAAFWVESLPIFWLILVLLAL